MFSGRPSLPYLVVASVLIGYDVARRILIYFPRDSNYSWASFPTGVLPYVQMCSKKRLAFRTEWREDLFLHPKCTPVCLSRFLWHGNFRTSVKRCRSLGMFSQLIKPSVYSFRGSWTVAKIRWSLRSAVRSGWMDFVLLWYLMPAWAGLQ